jgi:hypothetical protein
VGERAWKFTPLGQFLRPAIAQFRCDITKEPLDKSAPADIQNVGLDLHMLSHNRTMASSRKQALQVWRSFVKIPIALPSFSILGCKSEGLAAIRTTLQMT